MRKKLSNKMTKLLAVPLVYSDIFYCPHFYNSMIPRLIPKNSDVITIDIWSQSY